MIDSLSLAAFVFNVGINLNGPAIGFEYASTTNAIEVGTYRNMTEFVHLPLPLRKTLGALAANVVPMKFNSGWSSWYLNFYEKQMEQWGRFTTEYGYGVSLERVLVNGNPDEKYWGAGPSAYGRIYCREDRLFSIKTTISSTYRFGMSLVFTQITLNFSINLSYDPTKEEDAEEPEDE